VAWDDDDDWPEPRHDPESEEHRRQTFRELARYRQRALRWAYAAIAILIVVVVVVAITR
jgi:predicted nucleic acid-binding Zn ribbon protein